jgi:hypothetical protein
MAQFTRPIIVAACRTLDRFTHARLSAFLLDHALEDAAPESVGSGERRVNALIKHLLADPDAKAFDGEHLVDRVVRDLVQRVARIRPRWTDFAEDEPALARALERDGFVVDDGKLRRALPTTMDLPAADDEVHELLKRFGFAVPEGHLDQAIKNHADGNWAAANSQMRSFVEGLLDAIAETLAPQGPPLPAKGQRLNWLAKLVPPFILTPLNEWDGQGKGFLEAFFRRLHPQGSHPGLSDEDDSTFRLHLVLVVARLLLRRLAARV